VIFLEVQQGCQTSLHVVRGYSGFHLSRCRGIRLYFEIRDDSRFDSRGIPTFPSHIRGGLSHLLKLERNPAVPAQVERIPRSPSMITRDKA